MWAHEVGHAFTMVPDMPLKRYLCEYSGKQNFKERDEVDELGEDWADQTAEAIGFEEELKSLRDLPSEVNEKILMENGLLDRCKKLTTITRRKD